MSATIVSDGTKDGFALAKEAGAAAPLALVVEGKQRDLSFVPPDGVEVQVVTRPTTSAARSCGTRPRT